MATFTISLSGSSVVNGSKSWTISDADVQALTNYLSAAYGRPPPAAPLTPQQCLLAWVQDFVGQTVANVKDYQRSAAVITPITFG